MLTNPKSMFPLFFLTSLAQSNTYNQNQSSSFFNNVSYFLRMDGWFKEAVGDLSKKTIILMLIGFPFSYIKIRVWFNQF